MPSAPAYVASLAAGVLDTLGDEVGEAAEALPTGLGAGIADGAFVAAWFRGRLESAPTPAGPWTVPAGARSPWVQSSSDLGRFFRIRAD